MERESDWIFITQVFNSFFLVSAVLLGFFVSWILSSQILKQQKRPGINLKEL